VEETLNMSKKEIDRFPEMVPLSSDSIPARIFKRVVLSDPFGPMTPMRLPRWILNDIP